MARTTSRADALFADFTPLADSIARGFSTRGGGLIEFDDARQVARIALWHSCQRIEDPISAPAYLSRCIKGALLHHARDFGRTIRIPARAQSQSGASFPWRLTSLDAPCPSGGSLLESIAEPASGDGHQGVLAPDSGLLQELLESVPAIQATILRLHILEGVSLRQIASQLGISHTSVARQEKQALASLRQLLVA